MDVEHDVIAGPLNRSAMSVMALWGTPGDIASQRNGDAQVGCGNGGRLRVRARILAVEQGFELRLQLSLATVAGSGLERVHGRPVVVPELAEEVRGSAREVERIGAPLEGDPLLGHTRARETFDDVLLDSPGHGADETIRRGWRVRGGNLQNLGDERRIVGNPVSHDDPTARPRHADELLGHIEGFRREHRPEDADDEVEAVILEIMQIRRVAFLEPEVGDAQALSPPVAGRYQVASDVDTQHIRPEPGRR